MNETIQSIFCVYYRRNETFLGFLSLPSNAAFAWKSCCILLCFQLCLHKQKFGNGILEGRSGGERHLTKGFHICSFFL